MPNASSNKAVTLSVRVYQRLLAAYPAKYRREYGPWMAQLFRDQCWDAYAADGSVGLIKLWFRTLPDLIRTAIKERRMPAPASARVALIMRKDSMKIPLFTFRSCLVMIAPLLLIVVGSIVYTLNLTPVYRSTARIEVLRATTTQYDPYFLQTQFEIIQSNKVLDQVIRELGLERVWGERFAASANRRLLDARNLLLKSLSIRQIRNSNLLDIRVLDEDSQRAAAIANRIAEVYCRQVSSSGQYARARMLDSAQPGLRSVRPNVPMNVSIGLVLGMMAGALAFIIDRRLRMRSKGDGPSGGIPVLQQVLRCFQWNQNWGSLSLPATK